MKRTQNTKTQDAVLAQAALNPQKKGRKISGGYSCHFCHCAMTAEETTEIPFQTKLVVGGPKVTVDVPACGICAGALKDSAKGPHLHEGAGLMVTYEIGNKTKTFFAVVMSVSVDKTTFELAMTDNMLLPRITFDTIARDSVSDPWWAWNGDCPTVVGVKRHADARMVHRVMKDVREMGGNR